MADRESENVIKRTCADSKVALASALSEVSSEALFLFENGVCLDANQAASELFGYSAEEFVGMNALVVAAEESRELIAQHMRTGYEDTYEAVCLRKDGSTFPAELRGRAIEFQGRKCRASVIRDMSLYKRSQRELAESKQRYDLAIKGTNDGIWDWNRETDEVYFSPRWKEIIGYADDDLPNEIDEWKVRIHPDDAQHVMSVNDVFFNDSQAENFSVEYRLKHKDGDYRWILGRGTCLRDDAGKPFRMAGAHTDITAAKLAEEALRHSEEKWRQILVSTPQIGITLDPKGRILFANEYFCSLTGWKRDEVIGLDWSDHFLPEASRDEIRAFLKSLFDPGSSFELSNAEGEIVCKNGEIKLIAWSNVMSKDAQGNFVDVTCLGVDLTERERATTALEQAKEYAESANEAKSIFLATMSHEIRTPLNGIMGMLQLTKTTDLNSEAAEYLDTALSSCRDLLRILSDVLDLTRIEAGMFEISESVFESKHMVLPVVNTLEEMARKKGLGLGCEILPSVPTLLKGDIGRIRQIVVNLVNNAIKYTYSGTVNVTLASVGTPCEGVSNVQVQVTDTGMGIAQDKLKTIWEPFTQVDSSYTSDTTGIGLGLSIVRKLVESMGGRILIDSKAGSGTTVTVTLPLPIVDEQAYFSNPSESTPELSRQASCSVLLVEDDALNQIAIKTMLDKQGFDVDVANNGRDGVQMALENQYELILMDVQMPIMNGLEATKTILKEYGEGKRPPIIAMTAYAMSGDRESFLAAGMDDYLSKPIEFEGLVEMLAKHLGDY